jgi:eukaryotic-like serine/threonine-protein kinase
MDTTVADPLVGQVLDGRYLVRSRIAQGGMATVYHGHDKKLDRSVALKVMHAGLAADEGFVRRFIDEAKHAAALSHPNVVAVYDQGTDKGHVFLAMEYVPGRNLRDVLNERGRLGPREALQIMQPVLAALSAAHRAGLVHRDVKPENVLLTADGLVKVADFGLARAETASKQTKTGMIIGTVAYLAPEQVISGDADARTDVYAAGIMLFELLTGRQPHQGGTPLAVAYKHVNETVPLPSSVIAGLPPRLDALVATATSHDPARRPPDAGQFQAAAAEVYRTLPPDIDAMLAAVSPTRIAPQHATQAMSGPPDRRTMAISPEELRRPPTLRDRLTRPPGLYALVAAGVVVLMLLGGLVWFETVGNTERVPKLVGLSEDDARIQAGKVGLKVKRGSTRYDNAVPKDKVAEVQPAVGTKVKKGTLLTLIISAGKRPVPVPEVRGLTLDQAKQRLTQHGLSPGDVVQQSSSTVPRDQVIGTRPPAGDRQSPDDPVTIIVSTGIKMPNLVNMRREKAQQLLDKLGLSPQWQEQDATPGQVPDTVIQQSPPPGQPIERGAVVQLTVTKRQCKPFDILCQLGGDQGNPAPVPNVVGQPIDAARQALRAAGFRTHIRDGHPKDVVTGQNPPANTPLRQGSAVQIWH